MVFALVIVALTTAKYQLWTNCLLLLMDLFIGVVSALILVYKPCPLLTIRRTVKLASHEADSLVCLPLSQGHPAFTAVLISILGFPQSAHPRTLSNPPIPLSHSNVTLSPKNYP